jgi:SAM-dependent methyltransferase
VVAESERWNHNIHYHRVILDAVTTDARRALDVGCGEGMLTRLLHEQVPDVVGIDTDQTSIDTARAACGGAEPVEYIVGDFLSYPFEPESFDLITAVAALHHLDAGTALGRMRVLLKPGGTLAVVGVARGTVRDLPYEVAGAVATRVLQRRHGLWQHPSPICWPPPLTFGEVRRLSAAALPGVRYRRHVLWRYSLVWTKPPASS